MRFKCIFGTLGRKTCLSCYEKCKKAGLWVAVRTLSQKFHMVQEHKIYADNIFSKCLEFFPKPRRKSILDEVVLLGMNPFQVKLVAEAFAYKVITDKNA